MRPRQERRNKQRATPFRDRGFACPPFGGGTEKLQRGCSAGYNEGRLLLGKLFQKLGLELRPFNPSFFNTCNVIFRGPQLVEICKAVAIYSSLGKLPI